MLDVSLEDVIRALGSPTKKAGNQYYFGCPACTNRGEDSSKDNLLYNDSKKLLKCFACDDGAKEALKLINKQKEFNGYTYKPKQTIEKPKWFEINKDNLLQYALAVEDNLSTKAIAYLNSRCISKDVAFKCSIGYDESPSMVKIGESIVFPMFSLNHNEQLVGFELRQLHGGKVIKHTLDSPSCICAIYGKRSAKNLIITEGFIDAYSLLELLGEEKSDNYLIATGSHGCKSILPSLSGIDLTLYQNHYLLLDNDEAGSEATSKIIENYKFFKDKRELLKDCKDVNEYLCRKSGKL